jgi:hypothetical protein
MLGKIRASGLTAKEAEHLGFTPCVNSASEPCPQLKGIPTGSGFMIPYYSVEKMPLSTFRFRYALPRVDANGRQRKYSQPIGTPPAIYLPMLKGVNWLAIQANPEIPLVITEGELKAACATKAGHACIGLGGVWNFMSKALDLDFLPQLNEFIWAARNVTIVYDSDSTSNIQVQRAMNALARMLTAKRANVYIATPQAKPGEDGKVGLDDYIVDAHSGAIDTARLAALLEGAVSWRESSEIYKLNAEVAYIETPSSIVVFPQPHFPKDWQKRPELIGPTVFTRQRFFNRTHTVEQEDGKVVQKRTAELWFGDPRRRSHHSIIYAPGQPAVVDNQFNMWQGWPNEPAPGNVDPFLQLVETIFPAKAFKDEKEWFLNWLAYPIKHPGTKINAAVLLWGNTGTGKSTIGVTMQAIYGDHNCSVPGQGELERDFNSWLADKQFIIAEEVAGNDARKYVGKLKHMITGRTIHINKKGIEPFDYPNKANFLFTSNYSNALYIEEDDRRYFVHELRTKLSAGWWAKYKKWLYAENGAAHLHQWFIDRDTGSFDPNAPPMVTKSKKDVIESSMSELDLWIYELRFDPDSKLRKGDVIIPFRLWSIEELHTLFTGASPSNARTTKNAFGRAMGRGGFSKCNAGNWIQLEKGGTGKRPVWAVRNPDDAKLGQRAAEDIYQKERSEFKMRKF